jgi:hypothetical protein
MALIVEDGTIVTGANSYVSVANARTWATLRGQTFTGADSVVEARLVNAMDVLEGYRDRWKGAKTDEDQSLQWPRADVWIDGVEFPDDEIPSELVAAQIQLAYDSETYPLQPTGTGREVVRQKVDVIETEYAKRGTGTVQAQFNKAMNFLKPLMKAGTGLWTLEAVRA